MLSKLFVQNIALIEKLELNLNNGLNILTGETGAGKSIIIDSINFVLGERADKTLIRHRSDYAIVEAVFDEYLTDEIKYYLNDIGIECEEILIIKRKMTIDNKNECRINNQVVTLNTLKGLTQLLVDVYGQHQHQSLLNVKEHINFIDSIGKLEIKIPLEKYQEALSEYSNIYNQLKEYGDINERNEKFSKLKTIIEEIETLDLKENEYEELLAQREKMKNVTEIAEKLNNAKNFLDNSEYSISHQLKMATQAISSITSYDNELEEIYNRLDSAKIELDDLIEMLEGNLNSLDFNEFEYDRLETRIEEIKRVFKKYANGYSKLNEYINNIKIEYDNLDNADFNINVLTEKLKKLEIILKEKADILYKARVKVAKTFEENILKHLSDLGMGSTKFKVEIHHLENIELYKKNGADEVEFLIAPNAGEPLKPLSKIISGGEMSRFMLAVKNISSATDHIATMIFDEIDTGISGVISQKVAEKMCNISRHKQVIAITHLPQLASMADYHYFIEKYEKDNKTFTKIELLMEPERELARVLGNTANSETAIIHAKELLKYAKEYKAKL